MEFSLSLSPRDLRVVREFCCVEPCRYRRLFPLEAEREGDDDERHWAKTYGAFLQFHVPRSRQDFAKIKARAHAFLRDATERRKEFEEMAQRRVETDPDIVELEKRRDAVLVAELDAANAARAEDVAAFVARREYAIKRAALLAVGADPAEVLTPPPPSPKRKWDFVEARRATALLNVRKRRVLDVPSRVRGCSDEAIAVAKRFVAAAEADEASLDAVDWSRV